MKYEDLVKVNKTIKTTNIKGKEYAEVNQRIKAFRMLYPDGFILTKIVSIADGVCIMRAEVGYDGADGARVILAEGTAYEKENASPINKTSYIENCETSAVGRALGMLGIGIDAAVASAEEVASAMAQEEHAKKKNAQPASQPEKQPTPQPEQQPAPQPRETIDDAKIATLTAVCNKYGVEIAKVLKLYKVKSLAEMSVVKWKHCMDNIEKVKAANV